MARGLAPDPALRGHLPMPGKGLEVPRSTGHLLPFSPGENVPKGRMRAMQYRRRISDGTWSDEGPADRCGTGLVEAIMTRSASSDAGSRSLAGFGRSWSCPWFVRRCFSISHYVADPGLTSSRRVYNWVQIPPRDSGRATQTGWGGDKTSTSCGNRTRFSVTSGIVGGLLREGMIHGDQGLHDPPDAGGDTTASRSVGGCRGTEGSALLNEQRGLSPHDPVDKAGSPAMHLTLCPDEGSGSSECIAATRFRERSWT